MDDIINDFLAEASESLEQLDQKFMELEKQPNDPSLLNDIFRSIHTIKGAAGFLGFQQMVDVTHCTEDILNKLRKGEMFVTPGIMDAILQSVDLIKLLLNNIKEKNGREEDLKPTLALLHDILDGKFKDEPAAASIAPKGAEGEEEHKLTRPDETSAAAKEQSIRVDLDRLDSVLNLAGELVLSRNRLMRLGGKLSDSSSESDLHSHVNEAIAQLDLVTTDLQLAVMKMRMQPIAKVFNKFPRMVRDLARQMEKEVELHISGEETELDKTVIEEIGDPLVHIVRNSIDHGMESPAEREAKGKPRCGRVELAAYQEGRNIVVSIMDDGKGMDPEALKRSAVEKGLIPAEEAERLTKSDALNIIFIPGFSTAKAVSNISGRGVGMDVVKTNVSRINGTITIDSEVGKGTRITFRLPLTLAIIQALTVEAGGEVYGIPLSNVIENIRVTANEIKSV
ncbi:MAG: chemotaxis protein CheA, partial [Deltaproteobacteria bacterium]|nr:chemotaxis protein CheA [Deltaproteobacteria bacterium]